MEALDNRVKMVALTGGKVELTDRQNYCFLEMGGGTLGKRIESADRFHRFSEQIDPQRPVMTISISTNKGRWIQIDNAPAHREITNHPYQCGRFVGHGDKRAAKPIQIQFFTGDHQLGMAL